MVFNGVRRMDKKSGNPVVFNGVRRRTRKAVTPRSAAAWSRMRSGTVFLLAERMHRSGLENDVIHQRIILSFNKSFSNTASFSV